MDMVQKRKLYEKHYQKAVDRKKSVSFIVANSQGIRIRNCGKAVDYEKVDIFWKKESSTEEWHGSIWESEKQIFPSEERVYFTLADGKVLAADGLENENDPTGLYVCGCEEENDDIALLILITLSGGYVLQYWNGSIETPHIALTGKRYEETLPNLYRGIKSLLQISAQAAALMGNSSNTVGQNEAVSVDGHEEGGMDYERYAWER